MPASIATQLSLAPLGAGDLIDRAVRLYRRHLWTLMRIAAPPVLVSAVGGILWTVATRGLLSAPENTLLALYLFLVVLSVLIIVSGQIFNLLVMGGATHNLVS